MAPRTRRTSSSNAALNQPIPSPHQSPRNMVDQISSVLNDVDQEVSDPESNDDEEAKHGGTNTSISSDASQASNKSIDATQNLIGNQRPLVNRGSSGIGPKSLPYMTYELKSADNYEDWRRALEAYSLANNSWELIFLSYGESLKHMIHTYSTYRTIQDISQAHMEWCGKLFGVMYQSVMKLTGDVLLGELRGLQTARTNNVLKDPHHLLQYISNRYEKLSCFSRANDFMKVFSMTYDPSSNPAELREKLLRKILRFQSEDNTISEEMKMTIIYNTIPSHIQPLIRGYIPNKIKVTFDDVYSALKVMYDEKKSKIQPSKEKEKDKDNLTNKERRVLSILRSKGIGETPRPQEKRKLHCWYCDARDHVKFTCPKVNEDKKKGIDVKINPFKPKDFSGKERKQVMAALKRKQEEKSDDEDSEPGDKKVRFNMCVLNLENLETNGEIAGFIGQIIDNRILNSRKLHLDSGAFMHITSDRTILINIRKLDNPIPLTGAFGQSVTYVREVGDIVLSMGIKFREVGIVQNAHMTLISEARIQQAGYGINKPPGKAIAQIYMEDIVNGKYIKKTLMEFEKDKITDLWSFTMQEGHESPQERYLEQSGMVRFRPKSRPQEEEEKADERAQQPQRRIPKKGVQQKGGSVGTIQPSPALPKNKRKRK